MPSVNGRPDWKTLDRRIGSWLDSHRVGDAYRGDSAYEAEPARLPVAKTAAEIIAEVRDNAEWRALVPGLRHNSAESAITSSMIAVWCEVQEDNADERKEHKKTKKKRAEDDEMSSSVLPAALRRRRMGLAEGFDIGSVLAMNFLSH